MKKKVLLLDQTYRAIDIVTWKKAMTLFVTGRVEVMSTYDDETVKTPNVEMVLPSVIRLISGKPKYTRSVSFSRHSVYVRDNCTCQYCGKVLPEKDLTFDHVIPKSRNTPESKKRWENIVACCCPCNQKKANRTPEEAGMLLLKQPKKPKWVKFEIRKRESIQQEWSLWLP